MKSMEKDKLTQSRLKDILSYNQFDGLFTWLTSASSQISAGDIAGTINNNGYVIISIHGGKYLGHRLAFLYMTGKFPLGSMDHIDHVRSNNSWINLREATVSENNRNTSMNKRNKSNFNGVCFDETHRKWRAYIKTGGKNINIGRFDTHYAACYARHCANVKYGFHENHGRKELR